jgi:hypothetical protein
MKKPLLYLRQKRQLNKEVFGIQRQNSGWKELLKADLF